ncbi:MAG: M14 family metallopeptidase [Elusimicrobia bacterium]|nr:M14 family metallopeptidase [Elusimicrobiota bacterium]
MPRLLLAVAFALCAAQPAFADPGIRSDESNKSLTELKGQAQVDELPAVQEPSGAAVEQRYWVVVKVASRSDRTAVATAGMAIEEIRPDRVAGTAHIKTIQALQAAGYVIMFQQSLVQWSKDFPAQDKAYHNYDRMKAALDAVAKSSPKLASVFSIGKGWQGRDIWALRFNTTESGTKPSKKPGALFVGDHHAREHLSVEMPIKIAEYLAAHQSDAAVKKLLDSRDVYVVPMLNPDGAEYDISTGQYKWHRKNMRVNSDKEIGVDLNRNCDFIFGGAGSSGSTYSDTYHGPSAFSEPETKALRDFLDSRPNVRTLNTFHSYSDLIMYPWGGKDGPVDDAADLKAFQAMAGAMGKMMGFGVEQSNEMYVATGDCADWAYDKHKIFAFTTELGGGSFYPGAAEIATEAPGQIQAALYMVEYSDDPHRASSAFTAAK